MGASASVDSKSVDAAGDESKPEINDADDDGSSNTASQPALVDTEFRPLKLAKVKVLNYNTKMFRFNFPDEASQLHTNTACFYFVRATVDGSVVERPYTPVSPIDARGYLTLMVKIYDRPHGIMGNYLNSLAIGDSVEFRGPIAKVQYSPNTLDHVAMLAAGSGITPMYQLLRTIWGNPKDTTKVTLLFSNSREKDIVLRDELEQLEHQRPGQLKVIHTLTQVSNETQVSGSGGEGEDSSAERDSSALTSTSTGSSWNGDTGRIDDEKLKKWGIVAETIGANSLVLVCGPPSFTAALAGPKLVEPGQRPQQGELLGHLQTLGFEANQVFKF
eukprot:INCI2414.1.p1 GENE.INCI2414.1~~INCI2414.1.p1  ORF type:complete len:331 (-),score=61.88 INCI2414.1:50-1042(-)